MKKTTLGIFTALAAVSLAGAAQAQICAGLPTVDRQFSFGGNVQFPEGADFGDVWGVEASYNAMGPLSVFGGLTIVSADDEVSGESASEELFTVGLAFEVPAIAASLGSTASVCPVASLSYADIEDFGTIYNIPVGLGLGANFSAGTGVTISPYVIPQVIFSRFESDEDDILGEVSESETSFGISGGAILGFGQFWVGGTIGHVFEDEADPTFGIRFGIRL